MTVGASSRRAAAHPFEPVFLSGRRADVKDDSKKKRARNSILHYCPVRGGTTGGPSRTKKR